MKKTILTIVTLFAFAGTANAQQFGGGGGGGTGGGSTGGGRPGGSGGSGTAGSANANAANAGIDAGSLLGGFESTGQGSRSGAVSPSNPFAGYYANPYAAGLANGTSTSSFGTPVFGNMMSGSTGGFSTGGSGLGNRNSFGATGGMAGTGFSRGTTSSGLGTMSAPGGGFTSLSNTGGFGTTGGANRGTTGFGGTAGVSPGGGVSQLFSPPAPSGLRPGLLYSTTMRFKYNLPVAEEVQAELRNVVGRSSSVSVPDGVSVDIDSGVVVLRGQVADDDERRHVENLVRLSPGVRDVRNELTVR